MESINSRKKAQKGTTNGRETKDRTTADEHGYTRIKRRKISEFVLEKSIRVNLQLARHLVRHSFGNAGRRREPRATAGQSVVEFSRLFCAFLDLRSALAK